MENLGTKSRNIDSELGSMIKNDFFIKIFIKILNGFLAKQSTIYFDNLRLEIL